MSEDRERQKGVSKTKRESEGGKKRKRGKQNASKVLMQVITRPRFKQGAKKQKQGKHTLILKKGRKQPVVRQKHARKKLFRSYFKR